jgi:hypothetical protein
MPISSTEEIEALMTWIKLRAAASVSLAALCAACVTGAGGMARQSATSSESRTGNTAALLGIKVGEDKHRVFQSLCQGEASRHLKAANFYNSDFSLYDVHRFAGMPKGSPCSSFSTIKTKNTWRFDYESHGCGGGRHKYEYAQAVFRFNGERLRHNSIQCLAEM